MRTIAFSLGSKVLATGSNDGKIRLWEATTHVRLKELQGHEEPINAIAFSPNGEVLASGSDDGTVRLWNTASGEHLRTLKGHRGPIMAIAFSLNGEVLASGSDDNTVRVWNTASGKQLLTLNGIKNTEDNSCSFHSVAFSTHTLLAYGKDSGEETKIYHLCQELNLCGNIKEAIA
jgi:WD40 repeat protein